MKKIFNKIFIITAVTTTLFAIWFFVTFAAGIQYNILSPLGAKQAKSVSTFSQYLSGAIPFILQLAAVFAVVQIVIGGFQYALSEAMGTKQDAKDRMTQAMIGLVLALTSYLILYTISPNLVKLNIGIEPISKIEGINLESNPAPRNSVFQATCQILGTGSGMCVYDAAGTTGSSVENCSACAGNTGHQSVTSGKAWCKTPTGVIGPGSCTLSTYDDCNARHVTGYIYQDQCENSAPLQSQNPPPGAPTICWVASTGQCTTSLTEVQCMNNNRANRYQTESYCPPASLFTCKSYIGSNPLNCPITP